MTAKPMILHGVPMEMKKPIQVIMARTSKADFTTTDLKILNMLLAHASKEPNKKIHRIGLRELWDSLGLGYHERMDRITASVDRLFHGEIEIEWTEAGESHFTKCHYLSVDMSTQSGGLLDYAIDPFLIKFLHDPKVYSCIQLPIANKFSTNYALKLYEIMGSYIHRWSPHWHISYDEAMEFFVVPESNKRIDHFKTRVIDKAVAEVNLLAPFDVSVEFIRDGGQRGGKITALKFSAYMKPKEKIGSLGLQGMRARRLTERDTDTDDMFEIVNQRESMSILTSQLREDTEKEADRIIAGDGEFREYRERWIEEFKGKRCEDPDNMFLSWLRLDIQKRRDKVLKELDTGVALRNFLSMLQDDPE